MEEQSNAFFSSDTDYYRTSVSKALLSLLFATEKFVNAVEGEVVSNFWTILNVAFWFVDTPD